MSIRGPADRLKGMTTRLFGPAPSLRASPLLRWCLYGLAILAPGSIAIAVAVWLFRVIRQAR
jgi:hypothetical protein